MSALTPNPTFSFDTGTGAQRISIGGSPADSNIAASRTHLCLTARAAFACYDRQGQLIAPGTGLAARPYTAKDFFESLGVPVPDVPSGTPTKDGRVVYDVHLRRFFLVFQTREKVPRLLIATSKSENPSDGWLGRAEPVTFDALNGHDYFQLGVSGRHLLIANQMKQCTGAYPSDWTCTQPQTMQLMYDTADLAAGKAPARTRWTDPDGEWATPCVNTSVTNDAFWVRRDDKTHLVVWGWRNGQRTSHRVTVQSADRPLDGQLPGGQTLSYTNIGIAPQNAQYHAGRIVLACQVGHTWSGASQASTCVQLIRLNVAHFFDKGEVKVEIDRIFGRGAADDTAALIYDYGWPAVAMNARGDIVVGTVRSNSAHMPELRCSAWMSADADIRSSVLLKASATALTQFHMAGACIDPAGDGVFVSQQYGTDPSGWRVHVARCLS